MGNTGARAFGMEKAFTETKDSVAGIVAQVCPHSRHLLYFWKKRTDGMKDRCGYSGEGIGFLCDVDRGDFPMVEE